MGQNLLYLQNERGVAEPAAPDEGAPSQRQDLGNLTGIGKQN